MPDREQFVDRDLMSDVAYPTAEAKRGFKRTGGLKFGYELWFTLAVLYAAVVWIVSLAR